MIRIVSEQIINPDKREQFLKVFAELAEASRAEEGNIFYTLNQDVKDENHYGIIECWKDEDAIQFHFNTEHFKRLVPQMGECSAKEAPLAIYKEVL